MFASTRHTSRLSTNPGVFDGSDSLDCSLDAPALGRNGVSVSSASNTHGETPFCHLGPLPLVKNQRQDRYSSSADAVPVAPPLRSIASAPPAFMPFVPGIHAPRAMPSHPLFSLAPASLLCSGDPCRAAEALVAHLSCTVAASGTGGTGGCFEVTSVKPSKFTVKATCFGGPSGLPCGMKLKFYQCPRTHAHNHTHAPGGFFVEAARQWGDSLAFAHAAREVAAVLRAQGFAEPAVVADTRTASSCSGGAPGPLSPRSESTLVQRVPECVEDLGGLEEVPDQGAVADAAAMVCEMAEAPDAFLRQEAASCIARLTDSDRGMAVASQPNVVHALRRLLTETRYGDDKYAAAVLFPAAQALKRLAAKGALGVEGDMCHVLDQTLERGVSLDRSRSVVHSELQAACSMLHGRR